MVNGCLIDFLKISFNNRDPVYVQIAEHVKKQVLVGNAKHGEELPSRRELAAMLGINPNTVQKAYKMMEKGGFVTTSGNYGSVVCVNERILGAIEKELTEGMVKEFVKSAKEVNLSFKYVIHMVSRLWDEN